MQTQVLLIAVLLIGLCTAACPYLKQQEFFAPINNQTEKVLETIQSTFDVDLNNDNLFTKTLAILMGVLSGTVRTLTVTNSTDLPRNSLIHVVAGIKPQNRSDGTPIIKLSESIKDSSVLSTLFVPNMNRLAGEIEKRSNKRFYGVILDRLNSDDSLLLAQYDIGRGRLSLHPSFFEVMYELDEYSESIKQGYEKILQSLPDSMHSTKDLLALIYNIPIVLGESVGYCLACIIVLSIGIPLLSNYAFGTLASYLCTHYHLSQDECDNLVYMALLLGYISIFPGAYVVFKVCKVKTCGKMLGYLGTVYVGAGSAFNFIKTLLMP